MKWGVCVWLFAIVLQGLYCAPVDDEQELEEVLRRLDHDQLEKIRSTHDQFGGEGKRRKELMANAREMTREMIQREKEAAQKGTMSEPFKTLVKFMPSNPEMASAGLAARTQLNTIYAYKEQWSQWDNTRKEEWVQWDNPRKEEWEQWDNTRKERKEEWVQWDNTRKEEWVQWDNTRKERKEEWVQWDNTRKERKEEWVQWDNPRKEEWVQWDNTRGLNPDSSWTFWEEINEDLGLTIKRNAQRELTAYGIINNEQDSSKDCPIKKQKCRKGDKRYRTMDGSCNNLKHEDWGSINRAQLRLLEPDYFDGISSPRRAADGSFLPSAKKVSAKLMAKSTTTQSQKATLMMMQFGQFLDHDLSHTPVAVTFENEQCFKVLENSNGVHGLIASPETQDPPNTFYFGNTNGDSAACRELCLREPLCLVYVQHLADFAEPEWAGQCYGRSGFSDTMVGETGVESGTRGGCDPCFDIKPGHNAVYGLITGGPTTDKREDTFYFGNTSGNAAECRSLCRQEPGCLAYSQHLMSFGGAAWRGLCYGRSDYRNTMRQQGGMESGLKKPCATSTTTKIVCDPTQCNLQTLDEERSECYPIQNTDGTTCKEFVRSGAVIGNGCQLGPREQGNTITAYLDMSQVYGSEDAELAHLIDTTTCFDIKTGFNAVYGLISGGAQTDNRPKTFFFGNTTGDATVCRRRCQREPGCMAYSQHLMSFGGAAWRGLCYGRSDDTNTMRNQGGMESGTKTCNRGKMAVRENPVNKDLKPLLPSTSNAEECKNVTEKITCAHAGDVRQNEQVGLTAMHTLFVRMHNFIEGKLFEELGSSLDAETLFQETRKILISFWQNMVYSEYLPPLLGDNITQHYSIKAKKDGHFFSKYSNDIQADIFNAFSTAAFRFGHSEVPELFTFVNRLYQNPTNVVFNNMIFNPYTLYHSPVSGMESAIDSLVLGLISTNAGEVDGEFNPQITEHLFTETPPNGTGLDLPALNVQRGRDHGLPGYAKWREFCGLPVNLNDLQGQSGQDIVADFKSLYPGNINDVDLFPAGISEKPVKDGVLGPTFACIIALQFRALKFGDRFYYENKEEKTGFTEDQLAEVQKFTMARLLCDTLDDVDKIQPYVMLSPEVNPQEMSKSFTLDQNSVVDCDSGEIPSIDYKVFTEGLK